jgi:hypothetical protein
MSGSNRSSGVLGLGEVTATFNWLNNRNLIGFIAEDGKMPNLSGQDFEDDQHTLAGLMVEFHRAVAIWGNVSTVAASLERRSTL